MENINYEDRFVAFIDILGFKNLVDHSINDSESLSTIIDAMEFIFSEKNDNYKGKLRLD